MLRRHDLLAFQKLETCIFFVVVRNNEGTARHLPITDTVPGDCFGAGGCGPKAAEWKAAGQGNVVQAGAVTGGMVKAVNAKGKKRPSCHVWT